MSDHPRTCGANARVIRRYSPRFGSSPHMRGKRPRRRRVDDPRRIIPAHAGQTTRPKSRAILLADHPRTCGANVLRGDLHHKDFGSSPHMRGKHSTVSFHAMRVRIIPAHAGQTPHTHRASSPRSDHPRTCGANHLHVSAKFGYFGSSPHMRGKRGFHMPLAHCAGIIPAHAGQTTRLSFLRILRTDHPRTCGANRLILIIITPSPGSSPHMRGKRRVLLWLPGYGRIIPAHAGQTCPLV